jgi:flagellar FliL protein
VEEPPPPPPAGPPVFVNVGPLTVPVLGAERIDQFVTLMVALELTDMITAEAVRAQAPRLTDAFLTTIYGAIASGKVMSGGVLDVPQVKAKLRDAAGKVLGKDTIRDVLIQIVNQRPM